MQNCDYANQTACGFHTPLDGTCDTIRYSGLTPTPAIADALQCRPATHQWVQFFLPKILDIPCQKPDMEGIVSVNSCVEIISQRVVYTPTVTGYTNAAGDPVHGENIPNGEGTYLTGKKLIIEGILRQKVIYTALVEDQALHSASFSIPFSVFILVDGQEPISQDFRIYPYLEDVYACMLSPRSLFSNNTLFIKAAPVC